MGPRMGQDRIIYNEEHEVQHFENRKELYDNHALLIIARRIAKLIVRVYEKIFIARN